MDEQRFFNLVIKCVECVRTPALTNELRHEIIDKLREIEEERKEEN